MEHNFAKRKKKLKKFFFTEKICNRHTFIKKLLELLFPEIFFSPFLNSSLIVWRRRNDVLSTFCNSTRTLQNVKRLVSNISVGQKQRFRRCRRRRWPTLPLTLQTPTPWTLSSCSNRRWITPFLCRRWQPSLRLSRSEQSCEVQRASVPCSDAGSRRTARHSRHTPRRSCCSCCSATTRSSWWLIFPVSGISNSGTPTRRSTWRRWQAGSRSTHRRRPPPRAGPSSVRTRGGSLSKWQRPLQNKEWYWISLFHGPSLYSFSFINGLFSSNKTILHVNVQKGPSNFWCWDSNSHPFEHGTPLITTRPEFPPEHDIVTIPTLRK